MTTMSDDDLLPDLPPEEAHTPVDTQWWCASLGNTLMWARLTVMASGAAEVLTASGEVNRYDDETAARMALLDADYYAFDGLDEQDAALLGFDLDSVQPPSADNDAELLPRLAHKIARGLG